MDCGKNNGSLVVTMENTEKNSRNPSFFSDGQQRAEVDDFRREKERKIDKESCGTTFSHPIDGHHFPSNEKSRKSVFSSVQKKLIVDRDRVLKFSLLLFLFG